MQQKVGQPNGQQGLIHPLSFGSLAENRYRIAGAWGPIRDTDWGRSYMPSRVRVFVDFDGTISLEDTTDVVLERFEAEYLSRLLSDTNGNVSLAARRAQMDRSYLIKLLQRHRLKASKESE